MLTKTGALAAGPPAGQAFEDVDSLCGLDSVLAWLRAVGKIGFSFGMAVLTLKFKHFVHDIAERSGATLACPRSILAIGFDLRLRRFLIVVVESWSTYFFRIGCGGIPRLRRCV